MESEESISLLSKNIRDWNAWRLHQEKQAINILSEIATDVALTELVCTNVEFKKLIKIQLNGHIWKDST